MVPSPCELKKGAEPLINVDVVELAALVAQGSASSLVGSKLVHLVLGSWEGNTSYLTNPLDKLPLSSCVP